MERKDQKTFLNTEHTVIATKTCVCNLGELMSDGGKGDGRRKSADDAKYAEGWDRIFGNKDRRNEGDTNKGQSPDNAKRTGS